jgi:ABC-type taurine transport system substrate-binding protein
MPDVPLIDLNAVTKEFQQGSKVIRALDGVDLEIRKEGSSPSSVRAAAARPLC